MKLRHCDFVYVLFTRTHVFLINAAHLLSIQTETVLMRCAINALYRKRRDKHVRIDVIYVSGEALPFQMYVDT